MASGARSASIPGSIAAPKRPGLVLGLDRGGSCVGLAFRVPGDLREEVIAYLRERELVTNVYLERSLPVRLDRGGTVEALCYTVDRSHRQYAGALTEADAAAVVAAPSAARAATRTICVPRSIISRRSASTIDGWSGWRLWWTPADAPRSSSGSPRLRTAAGPWFFAIPPERTPGRTHPTTMTPSSCRRRTAVGGSGGGLGPVAASIEQLVAAGLGLGDQPLHEFLLAEAGLDRRQKLAP